MQGFDPTLLGLAGLLIAFFTGLVAWLIAQRRIGALREENVRLTTELEAERRVSEEKLAALDQARDSLTDAFSSLAGTALRNNSAAFLELAQENLKQYQAHAQGDLALRQKAVEEMVRPIRETLVRTEEQVRRMEKEREHAFGALGRHLESMTESQRMLHQETRNLVQALRRPEVRGQWGEMTLKRLAELSGMAERCDFYEQEQVSDGERRLRPDMVVRLPGEREIVVDAKTPLDAYLAALEAGDDETRARELTRHARAVRERVRELASKSYWKQFSNSPDFVVLFIPGDQFLGAALDLDHNLVEEALAQRVILATPTSFVALLRAVAFGWRQESLTANAEKIRRLGEELYGRLSTFTDHLGKLGKSLESSVGHFNRAVGSFDSRVLPGARKFTELGIHADQEVETPSQVETGARQVPDTNESPESPS